MHRVMMALATVGCVCLAAAGGEADSRAMQGDWVPLSAELSGQPFPDDVLKGMKLTITGDKYTVVVSGTTDRGAWKIDATKKPKALDIQGGDGPNQGKTFLAIYEVSDTNLRVCYDLTGKNRPTEFKTAKETLQFLVTYKRPK